MDRSLRVEVTGTTKVPPDAQPGTKSKPVRDSRVLEARW
jgi:hypothetical protein